MSTDGRFLREAMSTAERKKLEFTDTGYIENVKDVFKALDYYFGQSTKKDSQLAGKKRSDTTNYSVI